MKDQTLFLLKIINKKPKNKYQLWIPPGFAHGFYVMSHNADFEYKCTDYYDKDDEGCILWNDKSINIKLNIFKKKENSEITHEDIKYLIQDARQQIIEQNKNLTILHIVLENFYINKIKKYNLIILSDEIYTDLTFCGKYESISKYYPEKTFISGGLSKWCGAGGWRVGFFAVPDKLSELLENIKTLASESYSTVNSLSLIHISEPTRPY